jgi:hypothetical protein
MTDTPFSAATQRAIVSCVRSIEELEVLLFLSHARDRYWSPDSVGLETGLPGRVAGAALEGLASRNLLDVRIGAAVLYKLDPATDAARDMLERTIEAARTHRSQVLKTILAGASARDFADAFRVTRKRRSDG